MSQTLYYAQLDDEYFGPFALETIAAMHLTPDISVLSSDTNEWRQACEYPELINSLDLSLYEISEDEDSSEEYQEPTPSAPNRVPPSFNERSIFYIRRGNTPYGPYNLEALATVSLSEDTEISLDGMSSWFRAREISGLLNTLTAISGMQSSQQESQYDFQPETQPDKPDNPDQNTEISELISRIQGLAPAKKQIYKRVFSTKEAERDYIISEYNRVFNTLLNLVKNLGDICHNAQLSRKANALIINTVNDIADKINGHYFNEFKRITDENDTFVTSSVTIGKTHYSLLPPLDGIEIFRIDFLTVLGNKNLCVTYDSESENKAVDFVNTVIAKLYKSNPARLIVTNVVDTDFMTGLDDSFKLLNRDLYKVISSTDEVRNTLASLQERASGILRNLLVEKGATLQEYNSTHENKEANILLVLKDFPHGLNIDHLYTLRKLANVGPKVGIYLILLSSKENVDGMTERESEAFDIAGFSEITNTYHFKTADNDILSALGSSGSQDVLEGEVKFDTISESELQKIVKDINSKCELKEDVIVSIADYLPDTSKWWSYQSAKQIEIPFGVGNDMQVKSLKITQESGQNTAVVIGIPGSGKSVFLHSLICSAAIRYSPDELRMYLIDFSGVEFNSYALGKLPHARVIAPEAEREFGLSILNELVEEGSRRMSLCRDHNVSNIVDLKRVAPEIKVPRLLVIIDEFQKLFEIENDLIARDANSKIHIIIQEFRKFGINLIIATQKLPSGSFLPRDLIANRVVFKSAPNDFNTLISMEDKNGMPRMRTGQCIYNSESGATYANELVQGFFVLRENIETILAGLVEFGKTHTYEEEQIKVFRSNEQPAFQNRRMIPHHHGYRSAGQALPIYVGESVSVSDYDVCFELQHEGGNNLLVIGGESAVAESICYHSALSISMNHDVDDATFFILNGMRSDNKRGAEMLETLQSLPFPMACPTSTEDIEQSLISIKEKIDERRSSGETNYSNIYLTIFEAQNIRAFDQVASRRSETASQSATLLESIVKTGPSVGVFTLMQIDNLPNLARIGQLLPNFNHRIALQMPSGESTKIMEDEAASKLFIFNRPSSIYRAYLYDKIRNTKIKFKPYKS